MFKIKSTSDEKNPGHASDNVYYYILIIYIITLYSYTDNDINIIYKRYILESLMIQTMIIDRHDIIFTNIDSTYNVTSIRPNLNLSL